MAQPQPEHDGEIGGEKAQQPQESVGAGAEIRGFLLPEQKEAEETAWKDWLLLFQLDSGVTAENFDLMFGDSGSIYFYIRKEDLAARRFDRVWLIQQCC